MEFFRYLVDKLREHGAGHIRVYGGGGGVISPEEVELLHAYGVTRIFRPEDGQKIGLEGMIRTDARARARAAARSDPKRELARLSSDAPTAVARLISCFEDARRRRRRGRRAAQARWPRAGAARPRPWSASRARAARASRASSTSSCGASALAITRHERRRAARSTRRGGGRGGALLGDRIRMNAIRAPRRLRALARDATRARWRSRRRCRDGVRVLQAAELRPDPRRDRRHRPERLRDRRPRRPLGLRDDAGVRRALAAREDRHARARRRRRAEQVRSPRRRGRAARRAQAVAPQPPRLRSRPTTRVPVFATIASRLERPGHRSALSRAARGSSRTSALRAAFARGPRRPQPLPEAAPLVPAGARALPRGDRRDRARLSRAQRRRRARARRLRARGGARALGDDVPRWRSRRADALDDGAAHPSWRCAGATTRCSRALRGRARGARALARDARALHRRDVRATRCAAARSRSRTTCADALGSRRAARRAAATRGDWGELAALPAPREPARALPVHGRRVPVQARQARRTRRACSRARARPSAPTAASTCSRRRSRRARLSTAFDSVTLYGRDPDERPDISGKVGNSGVSVCTVDDAKKLYSGFDLCDAEHLGLDDDQRTGAGRARVLPATRRSTRPSSSTCARPASSSACARASQTRTCRATRARFRQATTASGSRLLGVSGDEVVDAETYARIRADVLRARARHRAGRHPEGGPGAEHLHLLDGVRAAS